MEPYASKPIVLIVMDGVGIAPPQPGNAVTKAKTPFARRLLTHGGPLLEPKRLNEMRR